MTVYPLFEHNSTGMAIPQVTKESDWVLTTKGSAALVTIKVDGVRVQVENGTVRRPWTKESTTSWMVCSRGFMEDWPILEAYENAKKYQRVDKLPNGTYEAFGPGIKGNRMKCEEPFMVCISPLTTNQLIVNRAQFAPPLGAASNDQRLFDAMKAELSASPQIEGFVLLFEETMSKPLHWASVSRKEFGLKWPVDVIGG